MPQIGTRTAFLNETRLIGMSKRLSLAENTTPVLWKSFMPRLSEIQDRLNDDLLSLAVYPSDYFLAFNPATTFERYAGVEVKKTAEIPEGMQDFVVPAGLYVVFEYQGSSNDNNIFQYIFAHWLPASAYDLDDRPHFEVLGANYKNEDAESEEELWIPVKLKSGL